MDVHARWKTLQQELGREPATVFGRAEAAAWLRDAAGLWALVVEPRRFAYGTGLLCVAAGTAGGAPWYRALGFHESGLLELREGAAGDFGLDVPRIPPLDGVRPEYWFEWLAGARPQPELLVKQVADCAERLSVRLPRKLGAASLEAFGAYRDAVAEAAGELVGRASGRLLRRLPDWLAGASRRVPVPCDIESINFFLDPTEGAARLQAVQTYPAAGAALLSRAVRQALDAGKPLAPALMREMGLNKAQLNALRSEALARSLCALLDGGRPWPQLQAALAAMPGKQMPWHREALDAGAAEPAAWAQLGRSLQKYPGSFVLVDGAPWIPGFCDDNAWGPDSPARQRLRRLRDTVAWMHEAIVAALPRRQERYRKTAEAWAARAVDAWFAHRRPDLIERVSGELHRKARELRGKWAVIPEELPLLIPDNRLNGIRFRQLRNVDDYAEEGAAMHHCVSDYFSLAIRGEYVAYRIEAPDRATLGLYLSITNQGTAQRPDYAVNAVLDQVQGPGNSSLPARYEEMGEDMARKLCGTPLDREIVEGFRMAREGRRPRVVSDAWKYPLYETVREELWRCLPTEFTAGAAGMREALLAEIGRLHPKKAPQTASPLDFFLPDEPLPPQFDPSVEPPESAAAGSGDDRD